MARPVERHLHDLQAQALRMGGLCQAILAKAIRSVWERDPQLAQQVPEDDLEIDRLDLAIDETVLRILALQSPVAAELRRVIGIKSMATDLERVGDLARNIAKSALRLCQSAPVQLPPQLETLGADSRRMLRRALDSFADRDTERALRVLADDDRVDAEQDQVIRDAIQALVARPERSSQEIDLIMIAKNLERVADHATNVAEHVVWIARAENLKHADKLAAAAPGATGGEASPSR